MNPCAMKRRPSVPSSAPRHAECRQRAPTLHCFAHVSSQHSGHRPWPCVAALHETLCRACRLSPLRSPLSLSRLCTQCTLGAFPSAARARNGNAKSVVPAAAACPCCTSNAKHDATGACASHSPQHKEEHPSGLFLPGRCPQTTPPRCPHIATGIRLCARLCPHPARHIRTHHTPHTRPPTKSHPPPRHTHHMTPNTPQDAHALGAPLAHAPVRTSARRMDARAQQHLSESRESARGSHDDPLSGSDADVCRVRARAAEFAHARED